MTSFEMFGTVKANEAPVDNLTSMLNSTEVNLIESNNILTIAIFVN